MSKIYFNSRKLKVCSLVMTLVTLSGVASCHSITKNNKKENTTSISSNENYIYNSVEERLSSTLALHIINNIDTYKIEKLNTGYLIIELDENKNEIRRYGFKYEFIDMASKVTGIDIKSEKKNRSSHDRRYENQRNN